MTEDEKIIKTLYKTLVPVHSDLFSLVFPALCVISLDFKKNIP